MTFRGDGGSSPRSAPVIEPFVTAGIDLGSRSVKVVLLAHAAGESRWLAREIGRVDGLRNGRDVLAACRQVWALALDSAGMTAADIALVASTGTFDRASLSVGHFYNRISQTVGARQLSPGVRAVLDIGASQARCVVMDAQGRIRRCRISERPPGAGDDVLAEQAFSILRSARVPGAVLLTGGMVLDRTFVSMLTERLVGGGGLIQLRDCPEALFTGGYGAALLAARRYRRFVRRPEILATPSWAMTLGGRDAFPN